MQNADEGIKDKYFWLVFPAFLSTLYEVEVSEYADRRGVREGSGPSKFHLARGSWQGCCTT